MKIRLALGAIALGLLIVFTSSSTAASSKRPFVSGPDPLVSVWSEWPHEVSCGAGLSFNPIAAFSGPTGVETGVLPSEVALREFLAKGELATLGVRKHGWRLLVESGGIAEFANGRLSEEAESDRKPGLETMTFAKKGGDWKWEGYAGGCAPRSIRRKQIAITWTLARGQRLGSGTRRINVDLGPGECDNGTSQNKRLEKPEFREQNGALLMSLWLRPYVPPPGTNGATCQGLIEPPVKIPLPEPLGQRRLLDGGTYPPSLPRERR